MLRKSKVLLLGLFLILFSSFAYSLNMTTDANILYISFVNSSGADSTKYNNSATGNAGMTYNTSNCVLDNCAYFDSSGADFLEWSTAITNLTSISADMSFSFWMYNSNTASTIDTVFSRGTWATGEFGYRACSDGITDGGCFEMHDAGVNKVFSAGSGAIWKTSAWHHVVGTYTSSSRQMSYWVDGVNIANATKGSGWAGFGTPTRLGMRGGANDRPFQGNIDEFMIVKGLVFNKSHVDFLYNGGAGQNPYNASTPPPANVTVNESTEGIVVNRQIGSVTFAGGGFNTINDLNFNLSVNGSPYYFSHTLEVASTGNNVIECQVLINDTVLKTTNLTMSSGDIRNMYLVSPLQNNDTSSYNEVSQCQRLSGGGQLTVSKSVDVGHILVDNENNILNHAFVNLTEITANATATTSFGAINFTTSNVTLDADHTLDLVLDYNAIFNFGTHTLVILDVNVNGIGGCRKVWRGSSSGGTGVGGNACIITDLDNDTTYVINYTVQVGIDTNGVNATALDEFNLFIKEFIEDDDERRNSGLDATITNSTFLLRKDMNLTNVDHTSFTLFSMLSASLQMNGDSGNTAHQINFVDGGTQSGFIYNRTMIENVSGIIVVQDVLSNASIDNYSVEYNTSCSNDDCTYFGGDFIGYFASIVPVILNSFNLSVFDNFDNSVVSNFTVTLDGGTSFSTTTGSVQVFHSGLSNLTISSNFSGGYFSTVVPDHNASGDLNVSLNQTLISWNCVEKVSGNNLNCTNPSEATVFNYNLAGNPNNQSINVTAYFENQETFNVTALQNQTLNSTFFSTNLTINSQSAISNVTSCNYTVDSINHTSFEENVTGSPNSSVNLINGSYSVLADCSGFAFQTLNVTIENVTQTLTFNLFTTNSVNLTFFDTNTNTILNGTNVTIQFIGATAQTNITNTGNIYVDLLNPSQYTLLFSAANYRQGSYIFTLDDRDNINIDLFMELENDTSLVLINVIDKFSKDPIQNAIVTIQKYKNNAWVTDQIISTDFQGLTEAYFVISTQFYNFLVEFEGEVFFGVLNSNDNKKTIFAEDVAEGITISIDTSPSNTVPTYQTSYDIVTSIRYQNSTNSSGFFIFTFDDTNNLPRQVFLNVTQGETLFCNNTVTSESGNLNCFVNVSLGEVKVFTGTGYILIGDEWLPVESLSLYVGIDETFTFDWTSTGIGYILAFFVVLIAYLVFAEIPSMSILSGTIAFCALILFRVIFSGLNLGLLVVFLFAAYLLSRIPSKSGVNV